MVYPVDLYLLLILLYYYIIVTLILLLFYNYRYTNYFYENETRVRDLFKLFGVHVIVNIAGVGRQYYIILYINSFDLVQTMLTIITGFGLLSIAGILTDKILEYFHNKKVLFENHKYEYLDYGDNRKSDVENKKNNHKNLLVDEDDGFF